jgi:hypothetical protein
MRFSTMQWRREQQRMARAQDAAHALAAQRTRQALSPLRVPLHESTDTFARMELARTVVAAWDTTVAAEAERALVLFRAAALMIQCAARRCAARRNSARRRNGMRRAADAAALAALGEQLRARAAVRSAALAYLWSAGRHTQARHRVAVELQALTRGTLGRVAARAAAAAAAARLAAGEAAAARAQQWLRARAQRAVAHQQRAAGALAELLKMGMWARARLLGDGSWVLYREHSRRIPPIAFGPPEAARAAAVAAAAAAGSGRNAVAAARGVVCDVLVRQKGHFDGEGGDGELRFEVYDERGTYFNCAVGRAHLIKAAARCGGGGAGVDPALLALFGREGRGLLRLGRREELVKRLVRALRLQRGAPLGTSTPAAPSVADHRAQPKVVLAGITTVALPQEELHAAVRRRSFVTERRKSNWDAPTGALQQQAVIPAALAGASGATVAAAAPPGATVAATSSSRLARRRASAVTAAECRDMVLPQATGGRNGGASPAVAAAMAPDALLRLCVDAARLDEEQSISGPPARLLFCREQSISGVPCLVAVRDASAEACGMRGESRLLVRVHDLERMRVSSAHVAWRDLEERSELLLSSGEAGRDALASAVLHLRLLRLRQPSDQRKAPVLDFVLPEKVAHAAPGVLPSTNSKDRGDSRRKSVSLAVAETSQRRRSSIARGGVRNVHVHEVLV